MGNDSFTPIGDRIEIVEIPPGPGILPLTALGDSFETIPEFAHSATAEFSARLFDEAGNFADGNTSTTTLEIDIETEAPTLVSFESDNTFSHLAKTGDTITISLTYPEDVNLPEITIDGNSSSESVLSARQFQSKYTFNGTEPEGLINTLQSSATDYLGNSGVYNGGLVGRGASAVR